MAGAAAHDHLVLATTTGAGGDRIIRWAGQGGIAHEVDHHGQTDRRGVEEHHLVGATNTGSWRDVVITSKGHNGE